ncbi:MAG: STAS domain-containing protein [Alphaproteobacteria bacterium]|nr:STAS domain-containing protein [Alphaproteobacteria bacterium]
MEEYSIIPGRAFDTLRLAPVNDVVAAPALKRALLELSKAGRRIAIDAEGVERITTPCVQVLLAARRALASAGHELLVGPSSPAFRLAFDDLGLSEELQLWGKIDE